MKTRNALLRQLAVPVAINLGLVVLFALTGRPLLGFLDPAVRPGVGPDSHTLPAFLQFVTLAWLADRLVRVALARPDRPPHRQPIPRIGLYFITAGIYVGFVSAGLRLVFFQPLETIFAASGIFTLVVGFALRGLVSDLFSGIALHVDKHIVPGDWVEIRNRDQVLTARVLEFDWRCTVLEDRWGGVMVIPNGQFSQTRIANLSRPAAQQRLSLRLEVAVEHDHATITGILNNACDMVCAGGLVLKTPPPEVRMREVAGGVIRFDIFYFVAPGASQTLPRHALLDAAIGFLKAAGIPLKHYEHQTVGAPDGEDLLHAEVRCRILRQTPFFAILDAPHIERLAEQTRPRRMDAGDVLFRAGDAGDSMFVVLQGRLGVWVDADGKRVEVATLWPRDVLGEMSLFTGAPRSATVAATSPATVLEIGKPLMAGLLAEDAGLAGAFAQLVVARQSANRRLVDDSRKTVETVAEEERTMLDRIARFFHLGHAGH
ncbi:MAG: mechanosensitive ion channel [Proteobacteria bacterium]|nr:mechanosensitive ion channel [Pseudomonadota bacterium]